MDVNSNTDSKKLRRAPADEDAIARFLGNLLGCEVRVFPAQEEEFSVAGAVVAAYVDGGGRLEALCICDVSGAAGLALAASIVNSTQLEAAIKRQRIDGVLRERLYTVCEFMGSLFVASQTTENGNRLALRDLTDFSESPADVKALLDSHSKRVDIVISVSGNDSGHLALLTR